MTWVQWAIAHPSLASLLAGLAFTVYGLTCYWVGLERGYSTGVQKMQDRFRLGIERQEAEEAREAGRRAVRNVVYAETNKRGGKVGWR